MAIPPSEMGHGWYGAKYDYLCLWCPYGSRGRYISVSYGRECSCLALSQIFCRLNVYPSSRIPINLLVCKRDSLVFMLYFHRSFF